MPPASELRWFQAPVSLLTAAAAAVAASRCEVWLSRGDITLHVQAGGCGTGRREQLVLQQQQHQQQQQQRQQPSTAADRLAFVVQPWSVTTPDTFAGEGAFAAILLLLLNRH